MIKIKKSILKLILLFALPILFAAPASANWSWSIGYNNPPSSTPGVNFMHLWSNWAFEFGVGYVGAATVEDDPDTTTDESDTSAAVSGDLDIKYLFGGSTFKPFIQAGTGYGVALGDSSGVGIGGFFAGGGFFLGSPSDFHVYASINAGSSLFFSLGIGSGF